MENKALSKEERALDTLSYIVNAGTQHQFYRNCKEALNTIRDGLQELAQYRALAEQIGCPLEVYAQLKYDTPIYDENGNKWFMEAISKDNFINTTRVIGKNGKVEFGYKYFKLSDHKKTWWLKQDKSE